MIPGSKLNRGNNRTCEVCHRATEVAESTQLIRLFGHKANSMLKEGPERPNGLVSEARGNSGESHPVSCCSLASFHRGVPFFKPVFRARSVNREEEVRRSWDGAKKGEGNCLDEVGKACCWLSVPISGDPKRNC